MRLPSSKLKKTWRKKRAATTAGKPRPTPRPEPRATSAVWSDAREDTNLPSTFPFLLGGAATGEAATGEAATGEAATGEATGGDGEAATMATLAMTSLGAVTVGADSTVTPRAADSWSRGVALSVSAMATAPAPPSVASVTVASTMTLAAVTLTSTSHSGASQARRVRMPVSNPPLSKVSTVPAAVTVIVNSFAGRIWTVVPGISGAGEGAGGEGEISSATVITGSGPLVMIGGRELPWKTLPIDVM